MIKNKNQKRKISLNILLLIFLTISILLGSYFYLKSNNFNFFKNNPAESFKEKSDKALLKTITPKAENFVKSFFASDFEKATIDFEDEMKDKIDFSSLSIMQGQTLMKTGNFQKMNQPIINKKEDNFLILEYPKAKFEKKEEIIIQIFFKRDTEDNLKISGFWFDSPNKDLWEE